MSQTTDWMTAADLAGLLGISLKTLRRRVGDVVDGRRYERRDVRPRDHVHHRTQTLFRVVATGADAVERQIERLPDLDASGQLRWSEDRRAELVDANNGLRRCIVALEQQIADLQRRVQTAAGRDGHLIEAMFSALGGVDEDDMREILAQALREHVTGSS